MRFIPTMLHGLADYLVGIVVIALPFYFGWTDAPRNTFLALGAFVILYSLVTDYELGLLRYLRIRFHLLLDALFGIAMLAAPTLLDLPADARTPVYAIGVLALLLVFVTKVRAQGTHSQSEATA
jgi:hypothetical protein